jgi:aconitate hydratase 1
MDDIVRLLARCGVSTEGHRVYEYPTRRSTSSYPGALDGAPRVEVRLVLPDSLSFVERVGYRYCVDKQIRASAAAVYWRTVGRVEAGHRAHRSAGLANAAATALLELETPARPPDVLLADSELPHDSLALPTMALEVVDRHPAGRHPVFDLAVDDVHAFVAGTVAVHNCIGNSGPLPETVAKAVDEGKLVAAAVLSGNRNFEGRVNPLTRANYLASPPLVVAYALAGRVDVDFDKEPLGEGADGKAVFLRDIWPTQREIADTVAASLDPGMFAQSYGNVFDGNPRWNAIPVAGGERYRWDQASTYIHEPPFFQGLTPEPAPVGDIKGARCLAMVGDSVTTDHISPAGDIALASPAGAWLRERGVEKRDFNSYGSRRGHDQVMVRGTFANIRLKNLLVPGSEGNVTVHFPSGEQLPIFDASDRYRAAGTPLVVLAGKEYGSGSSRDWAAKGTLMLGVRAVLAESFERIHRSNLVGMGVLPMVYEPGQSAESLGLSGRETFDITGLTGKLEPRQKLKVRATREDGSVIEFTAIARLDTPVDVDYYRNGGILQTVLRNLLKR